jgi:polyisoprenoid-binding protein YceI
MTRILLALALAIPIFAAEQTVQLTPENTNIEWTLSDPLHTVHGTFKLKHGSIAFDTATGKASGEVVVDVKSGESGSEARDSRMHKNVLESAKYPEAIFTPDHIEGKIATQGVSSLKLHGSFQIHGSAHEITMDVLVNPDLGQTDASFAIPYVAWGMKDPSNFLIKVGKTVQMKIQTTAAVRP